MSYLTPVSRRKLIERLTQLGFDGPYTGGRHMFMLRGEHRLIIPNPHEEDIGVAIATSSATGRYFPRRGA